MRSLPQKTLSSSSSQSTTPPESPEKVSVPVRPFPEDALYQLLLAEISGYRGAYDEALAIYREQALRLQDPGVALEQPD